MKIVFRLNYHTIPGQSLWLKYSTVLDEKGVRFDQVVPLQWLDDRQWEACVNVGGAGRFRLEYNYQLRQSGNGVVLDEWGPVRVAEVDLDARDAVVLMDEWCSAGTADYAYDTKAFLAARGAVREFSQPGVPANANHSFQLRMEAVPEGKVPCLLGSVSEMGNWGWHSAVTLDEVAEGVWQTHLYLPPDWRIEYKYGLFDQKLGCVVGVEHGENRSLDPRNHAPRQWVQVRDECYRRDHAGLYHAAGVSIPVFSLRSDEGMGIGEFADLKPLADWACGVGLKLIQILPVNDTTSSHDWTDSYPYSAISVFALHPIYLRIQDLDHSMSAAFKERVLSARESLNPHERVDHEAVMNVKMALTREVFEEHRAAIVAGAPFREFLSANEGWVVPYAVFCVKRDHYGTADFSRWEEWAVYDREKVEALTEPSHPEWHAVAYHIWLQQELDKQLSDAVAHLHSKGLALKGDLPIGIDRQSVDAWAEPHLFKMDAQAGAPPDAFAVKGQNWGFPTYDWEVMRRDGYAWWRSRFGQLSRYFDAYRIDHILGFFRIWQVPYDHVEGIMGFFDPALPIHIDEIRERGIAFDYNRYCRPYIRWDAIAERFGDASEYVKNNFLHEAGHGYFQLRENVLTQRRIDDYFQEHPHEPFVRQGLLDCAAEVLFFEVAGSHGTLFHPRMSMQATHSYRDLDPDTRWRVEELYNDYFFRRQEEFWQGQGLAKLPAMRRASDMLLCGEDLGMVPACVPGVLKELGILSLEIQRMPKTHEVEFYHPQHAPYMSVVSPSTHDMSTLRGWWEEDAAATARFAWQMFGISQPEKELSGDVAAKIIWQHLQSPAMWAIFPLQDLLAMDEELRHPVPEAERINVPAVIPYYWRYRMHLSTAQLATADGFNKRLRHMIVSVNR
ncbi:4-alpha-glucanotransferase [Luteolibacter yonseiensis]|uniref:4-alpha-glucanotransferase n=1 Tax=Luteolibacter yonseiensis TaxID=1144680 RepID=A0A934R501_9BACT|nr:4-alpha-glucanotransferase [Luteolibacter yonseiensis]MBK1817049.1 4-alpha-glucanotransferase [Luteolibacter yonseiensis]